MKIKLISPQMSLRPMGSEYKRLLSPSIALLVLAALTPEEHDVWIEDENAGPLRLNDFPDLVGITVNVDTSARAYAIADHYRDRDIPVVLGGIHPSACPDEAALHATSVCVGEAEGIWHTILNDAYWKQLRLRYFCDSPVDMSASPAPRWNLLDQSKYLYTNIVCASRGFCRHKRHYCCRRFRWSLPPDGRAPRRPARSGKSVDRFAHAGFIGIAISRPEKNRPIPELGRATVELLSYRSKAAMAATYASISNFRRSPLSFI